MNHIAKKEGLKFCEIAATFFQKFMHVVANYEGGTELFLILEKFR